MTDYMNSSPHHEKLFDEICTKLTELGQATAQTKSSAPQVLPKDDKIEKLEQKLKKSQFELQSYYSEIKQKQNEVDLLNRTLNTTQSQLNLLMQKLEEEKEHNHSLNADLSKSLELSLKSQLELQETKAKLNLILQEEKKYSESLETKVLQLENECELSQVLHDELKLQYQKAKEKWSEDSTQFKKQMTELEEKTIGLQNSLMKLDEKMVKFKILKNKAKMRFKAFQHKTEENFKQELVQLKSQILMAKSESKVQTSDLEKNIHDLNLEKNYLQSDNDKLKAEVQFKTNEIQRLMNDNNQVLKRMDLNNKEHHEIKSKIESQNKTLHMQTQHLEAQIHHMRQERIKENQQTLALMESRDLEIQRLNQELKKAIQIMQQGQQTQKQTSEQLHVANAEKSMLVQKIESLEKQTHQDKTTIDNLMSVAEEKIVELKINHDKKLSENQQMEKAIRQYQMQNEHLMMELARLKQHIMQRPT